VAAGRANRPAHALMLGTAFAELKMLTVDERVVQNAEALGLA
jgi:hypothetical protein